MELVIYSNKYHEDEQALVNLETNAILLQGDFYHDKIDYQITGYIQALIDLELIEREDVPDIEDIKRDHTWFNKLNFYDNGEDEE
ncbi:transcriptional regulator [Bacillus phage Moonbeam]|uniref:Uncharacterized protein n=1 Tax=Bacillus phage Moonbeam TaxID=1540091 RepID=A0A0A0RND2_9CAUD|nr:transcriptional regulator [Bacillus phage Moonbeam]AIW03497.1 hypothetical protein CPT_Moonbeam99 [Bacillus phage Moonbeam]